MHARRIVVEGIVVAGALALVAWAWRADLRWFERHVFADYCATSRAGAALPSVARAAALALALVAGVVARRRVAAGVALRFAGASAGGVASVALAVAAALVVSELVLRATPYGEVSPIERKRLPRAIADPVAGWRFAPRQTAAFDVAGRRVEYAIDAGGYRTRSEGERVDPDLPSVVVAGESIAFGESQPFDETVGALLAADLHLQLVNVGVSNYGAVQVLQRVVDVLPRLRRPVALVATFVPKMIRRDGGWRRGVFGLDRFWRDEPYHGDAALERTRAALEGLAREARAHGATPLFLVTNYGPACVDPDAWIVRTLFADAHLPFVRVDLGPQDVVGGYDHHPNARGARRLADAVVRAIRTP